MNKGTDLKRDAIKYIRDKAKKSYNKTGICEICGSNDKVDFHHYYSMTALFEHWVKENAITIDCEEDVLAVRDRFIEEHNKEIYKDAANLCHMHHEKLHKLYGVKPLLNTAEKQRQWVEKQ